EERVQALLDELRQEQLVQWEQDGDEIMSGGRCFVWPESLHVRTAIQWDREAFLAEDSFYGDLLRQVEVLSASEEQALDFVRLALEPLTASVKLDRLASETVKEQWSDWLEEAEAMAMQLLTERG